MRIHGSRALKTLPGQCTRPTTARVREALFNIWQGTIAGCRWLDLCAGSGAVGAEALNRGARTVVGIERSGRACEIIERNWRSLAGSRECFQVLRSDAVKSLERLAGEQFDRIYFDPPYDSGLYGPVLAGIVTHQLLDEGGEMAVEHDPKFWKAIEIEGLLVSRQKKYGNTHLTFYRPG